MIVGGLLGESVGVSTKLEPRREARFPLCKVVARFEAPPLHQYPQLDRRPSATSLAFT